MKRQRSEGSSSKKGQSKILSLDFNGDGCVRLIDFSARQPRVMEQKSMRKIGKGEITQKLKINTTFANLNKKQFKILQSTGDADLRTVCLELLASSNMINSEHHFVLVLLCSMLGRISHIAATHLPNLPILHLENLSTIPSTLELIVELVGGPEYLKGKKGNSKWKTCQPNILKPYVPMGSGAPSQAMVDYTNIKVSWKEKKICLSMPFCNRSVVIAPNIARGLRQQIIAESPLLVPICCGFCSSQPDRTTFKIDGREFDIMDPQFLQSLKSKKDLIAAILELFFASFQEDQTMQEEWVNSINDFIPVLRQGRFKQKVSTGETMILSASLALWKSFLVFVSEEYEWISLFEAHDSLIAFWRLILPESAPKKEAVTSSFTKLEDTRSFLSFLQEYCLINREKLLSYNEPWNPNAVGMFRRLPKQSELLLIFPRETFFEAYLTHIQNAGGNMSIDTTVTKWHTTLQRILCESLDCIKTEGKDTTWRYQYYPKEALGRKIPCLAIVLETLPTDLKTSDSVFGQMIGRQMPTDRKEKNPIPENSTNTLEDA